MFLKLVNLFEEPLIKTAEIVQKDDKYYVLSEKTGKSLGGPYDTKDEAVKRLGQIHYFKKHADFSPDYTPEELHTMNVYREIYDKTEPQKASMTSWPEHWLIGPDKKGWLEWYENYHNGRRIPEIDAKQIQRWNSFKARHGAQYLKNPTERRKYALRNWAIDADTLEKTATPSLDIVNDAARNRLLKIVRKLDTIQDSESLNKKIDIDKLDKYIKKSKRQLHNIGNDMATVPAINLTDNYSKFLDLITTKYTYSKDLN